MSRWAFECEEWCRKNSVKLTPDQRLSVRYLQRHGQRFMIEFGYGNAIEKARELKRERRRKAHTKRPDGAQTRKGAA
jgi:hypothetical protein